MKKALGKKRGLSKAAGEEFAKEEHHPGSTTVPLNSIETSTYPVLLYAHWG